MSREGVQADASAAEDFVRRFAEYWRRPTPEGLATILASDVRLVTPMTATTESLDEARAAFDDLFALIPDLTAEVHRWGQTADGVMIEFTLSGSAAGGPISWDAVDRFVLRDDGLATERISYFDSMPIALTVARRPRAWPRFVRSRLRR